MAYAIFKFQTIRRITLVESDSKLSRRIAASNCSAAKSLKLLGSSTSYQLKYIGGAKELE